MADQSMGTLTFELSTNLGAIEIGTLFSVLMLGILTAQVYHYVRRLWNSDSIVNRLLVSRKRVFILFFILISA